MSEDPDKFFKYEIIREKPSHGEAPFEILHAIMHERTGIDLCMDDKERRVRDLLQWLNANAASYYVEYDEPKVRRRKVKSSDNIYRAILKRTFDDDEYDDESEEKYVYVPGGTNIFYLYVPHETATLMKLFFEDFEHIPDPEPEPAPLDIDAVVVDVETGVKILPEQQNVTKADVDAMVEKPKILVWLGRFANNRRLPSDAS